MKIFFQTLVVSFGIVTGALASQSVDLIKSFCLNMIKSNVLKELSDEQTKLFQGVVLPAEDIPDEQTSSQLENECSQALYYGYNGKPDYVKAHLVAYAELRKMSLGDPDNRVFDCVAPASVLMMVYANGQGVKRNFELAMFFAAVCSWAPAEFEARIAYLTKLRDTHWQGDDFRFCDHITSGVMGGVCADISDSIKNSADMRKVSAITASWNTQEKAAFERLQKVANAYFGLKAGNETDASGTLRGAFFIKERAKQRDSFLRLLYQLERKKYPVFSMRNFKNADASLNKVYQKLMNAIPEGGVIESTTIKKGAIKETERQWIIYRDAWVTFAKIKYPEVKEVALKTYLTRIRIRELESLRLYQESPQKDS